MYRLIMTLMVTLLLSSCMNSPTRGGGSSSYATRDVEVVFDEVQTYPRIALILGNDDYQKNTDLTNAVADARAMKNFFENKGFKIVDAVNADYDKMKAKIKEFFSKLGKKSVAIIYYAGHASQDRSRITRQVTNYLIPINDESLGGEITDYDRDAISFNYILNKADEINHGLNIAMLDACRTPIVRGNGIENISAEGVYLVYATSSGATASDSGKFRRSFLKYAETSMKLTDIFSAVKRDLRPTGQKPVINDETNGEPFYFNKPKVPRDDEDKPEIATPPSSNHKEIVTINGLMYQNQPFRKRYKWNEADNYCKMLSLNTYRDWRLPTIYELKKIILSKKKLRERSNKNLKIRQEFHQNLETGAGGGFDHAWFWSLSEYERDSKLAWFIRFDVGPSDDYMSKERKLYTLCVRRK